MQCSRSSFSTKPHERLGNEIVDELCCRNAKVEVVKDEGTVAPVRCLHFVFPLTQLGLVSSAHATSVNFDGQISMYSWL